ncbi:response regulator [Variovorax paradoxus]|uniref:Virulence sensor protein BvgS n=1 Tax=Variovorax paradoxus TaxID=34073 RepID=A0A5Q0M759_VARPD|nr:ATP-binding protein [Variovorax paradoxus]QFZ85600.1 response regulator [Variovorax paradoxus]
MFPLPFSSNASSTSARQAHELNLLRRYQHALLFGGGALLSLLIVLAAGLVLYNAASNAFANLRTTLATHSALMQLDIEEKQTAMRRGVVNAELLWNNHAPPGAGTLEAFVRDGGQVTLQAGAHLTPAIAAVDPARTQDLHEFAPYLGMLEMQAYSVTAVAQLRNSPLGAYGYSPDHRLLTLMPAPEGGLSGVLARTGLPDTATLIESLSFDLGDIAHNPALADLWRTQRRVAWQPPAPDLLMPDDAPFKLVQPGFDAQGKPFMVFVSNLPSSVLASRLRHTPEDTAAMLVDRQGRVLLSADHTGAAIDGPALMETALAHSLRKASPALPRETYRAGVFSLSTPLNGTDWSMVYAYSWRTVFHTLQPQLLRYGIATLVVLGALWGLLLLFKRKLLEPAYRRSQRVFESEQLNRAIIDTSSFGVCLIALDNERVLLQNAMMQAYTAAAASPDPLHQQMVALFRARARDRALHDADMRLALKNGQACDLLLQCTLVRYQGTDALLCGFSDATERKELEKKREEAREAAEAANRAKSVFIATMSHEIRTPLNAVLGNLELLGQNARPEVQARRLQSVRQASRTLLDIVNNILDLSKMESGHLTLETVRVALPDIARASVEMFEPSAHAKGLRLDCVVHPGLAAGYEGDPTRIRQIVVNLLSNAIKFTAAGAVTLEVGPRSAGQASPVVIRVSDTGMGVPAEQIPHLFEIYMQASASTAREFGGSGLGLSICQRLAHKMGGTITVSSQPGAGSCFTVEVPLVPLADNVAAAPEPRPVASLPPRPVRLLVVDDHPANRALIGDQLGALGFDADVAPDGEAALALLATQRYDLVLTDLNMPRMDGYTLARRLRERMPSMPLIAITAHLEQEGYQQCSLAGFAGVLLKPVLLPALEQAILKTLGAASSPLTAPAPVAPWTARRTRRTRRTRRSTRTCTRRWSRRWCHPPGRSARRWKQATGASSATSCMRCGVPSP